MICYSFQKAFVDNSNKLNKSFQKEFSRTSTLESICKLLQALRNIQTHWWAVSLIVIIFTWWPLWTGFFIFISYRGILSVGKNTYVVPLRIYQNLRRNNREIATLSVGGSYSDSWWLGWCCCHSSVSCKLEYLATDLYTFSYPLPCGTRLA